MEELAAYRERFAKIKTDLTIIKWMVGVNLAASFSIVIKIFVGSSLTHMGKASSSLPAIR